MPARRTRGAFAAKKIFREIRWEVAKVVFLNELLNAAIVFFALNIILTLFNMSFYPSLAVAIVFFAARATRGLQKKQLLRLEEGNPEVHEILRTAYEYQREESLMAHGLMFDLQRRLATVSTGVLLNPNRILTKITTIAALAFVPVIILSFLPFLIQQNPLEDVNYQEFFSAETPERVKDYFEAQLNTSEDVYGDAEVIALGDDELGVQIQSGGSGVTFDQLLPPEQRSFTYNDYPADITPQEAESASGREYTEDELALINDYACETRGACD